jgi:hypothetical protein
VSVSIKVVTSYKWTWREREDVTFMTSSEEALCLWLSNWLSQNFRSIFSKCGVGQGYSPMTLHLSPFDENLSERTCCSTCASAWVQRPFIWLQRVVHGMSYVLAALHIESFWSPLGSSLALAIASITSWIWSSCSKARISAEGGVGSSRGMMYRGWYVADLRVLSNTLVVWVTWQGRQQDPGGWEFKWWVQYTCSLREGLHNNIESQRRGVEFMMPCKSARHLCMVEDKVTICRGKQSQSLSW